MTWPMVKVRDIAKAHYGKALKKEFRDESGSFEVFGSSGQVGVHSEALINLVLGYLGGLASAVISFYFGASNTNKD